MESSKSFLTSRTVWSSILVVVALALKFLGYELTQPDSQQLVDLITNIMTLIGGVMAIIWRIRATKKLI